MTTASNQYKIPRFKSMKHLSIIKTLNYKCYKNPIFIQKIKFWLYSKKKKETNSLI